MNPLLNWYETHPILEYLLRVTSVFSQVVFWTYEEPSWNISCQYLILKSLTYIYLIPQYVWPRYRLHVIVNSNVGNTFWRQVLQIQIQIQKNWCYWSSIVEFLLRALTLNLNWSQSCLPKYYGLFIVSQIFLKLFGNQRQSFKNHSFWKKLSKHCLKVRTMPWLPFAWFKGTFMPLRYFANKMTQFQRLAAFDLQQILTCE